MAQIAKTHKDYLNQLIEQNIKVIPLERYTRARDKILHKCICGKAWTVSPHNVLHNRLCGCTRGQKKMEYHQKLYLKKLAKRNIKVIPLEPYIGFEKDSLHQCTCGRKWTTTPSEVLRGNKCGCGYALSTQSQPLAHEEYLERLKERNIKVKPLESYVSSHVKILHLCTCGTKWKTQPANVLSGKKCGCVPSVGEEIIKEYLERKNIDYEQQVIFNDLKSSNNKYLKYDFAIRKNNQIILLIEYQGKPHYEFIPHFHKDFFRFFDSQDRDKRKREYAQANKIPLIEIPFWENTIEYLEDLLKKGSG